MTKTEISALLKTYQAKDRERLVLAEKVKKLDEEQKSILDQLTAANVRSDSYGSYYLSVSTKKVPRCTDWPGFHAYLKETGNFDMLHKRLTETAVMARLDDGEYVPGIVTDEKVTYKVTAK